jgi:hypothetical protein
VPGRRGFGDESWRLAQAGDGAGLHRAADLLLEGDTGDLRYDGHRARAFALALAAVVAAAASYLRDPAWSR